MNDDGLICCCEGHIVDPHNPAETMLCCRDYIKMFDNFKMTEQERRKRRQLSIIIYCEEKARTLYAAFAQRA